MFEFQHKQEKIEHGKVSSDFTNKGIYEFHVPLINKIMKKMIFYSSCINYSIMIKPVYNVLKSGIMYIPLF